MNLDMRKDLVLIADSDTRTALVLAESFHELNLDIAAALSGSDALKTAFELKPKIIVLEVDLSDMSGFDLCKRLLGHPKTADIPLIFYSNRTDEIDVVVGFEIGASDYVPKTVSSRELALRINAILKRSERRGTVSTLRAGGILLDLDQSVASQNGARIMLSPTEFQILAALAKADGRVLKRREIIEAAWPSDTNVMGRTVDAHVKSLRAKLSDVDFAIVTVRGIGYCLRTVSGAVSNAPGPKRHNMTSTHQEEKFLTSMNQPNIECRQESGR
jgi:DNA-binding response OmpR family regulator